MNEDKIKELLIYLKYDMENKGRDINTYRYKIKKNDLISLKLFKNVSELREIIKECRERNFLKQIELGTDGSFAFTEIGLKTISAWLL